MKEELQSLNNEDFYDNKLEFFLKAISGKGEIECHSETEFEKIIFILFALMNYTYGRKKTLMFRRFKDVDLAVLLWTSFAKYNNVK